jgi:hypothetical protein
MGGMQVVPSSIPRVWLAVPLALLATACVKAPPEISATVIDEVGGAAAAQVKRCYRSPRVASSGKQISTRLYARYNRDGSLAGMPLLISQSGITPMNRPYAVKMAQAAGQAVARCVPVRLPKGLYERGWDELILTFSPSVRV